MSKSDLVVTRPAGSLDALVTEEVEISLSGVVDPLVHYGPRQSVAVAILVVVRREKPAGIESKSRDFVQQTYLVW